MNNEKAIYEIADILHCSRAFPNLFRKAIPEEIFKSWEYKIFEKRYPELSRLIKRKV